MAESFDSTPTPDPRRRPLPGNAQAPAGVTCEACGSAHPRSGDTLARMVGRLDDDELHDLRNLSAAFLEFAILKNEDTGEDNLGRALCHFANQFLGHSDRLSEWATRTIDAFSDRTGSPAASAKEG